MLRTMISLCTLTISPNFSYAVFLHCIQEDRVDITFAQYEKFHLEMQLQEHRSASVGSENNKRRTVAPNDKVHKD